MASPDTGFLTSSIKLGHLTISPPLMLAPMAENTSWPFRMLCRRYGAAYAVTEMVTTHPFAEKSRQTMRIVKSVPGDKPLGIQICGNEPDLLEKCAINANEIGFDVLDFNLGCPVRRMVFRNYGGGLSRDPERIRQCLNVLVKTSRIPVTVKIRTGFDKDEENAVEIAKIAEDCGVAMISVHARTVAQRYSGKADWSVIARVKQAVSVPVVGNGDVVDGTSADRLLAETNCDGIMIGRAALGKPWIFRQVVQFFQTGQDVGRPSWDEIKGIVREHAAMLAEYVGDRTASLLMRRYLVQYCRGLPNSAEFRKNCQSLVSIANLGEMMDSFPFDHLHKSKVICDKGEDDK